MKSFITVVRDRTAPLRSRYGTAVEPTSSGLPNRRVLLVPLALLAVVFVALVALGVTGTSTGYLHQYFANGADPQLIEGTPQAVRSDEWLAQTSWTISQYEQGLPVFNETFPGGMDATVQHDLPSWDWSVAFRPHLVGFWFLPLANAMAVKWWFPGFALIAALYVFVLTLLPRRPVVAALVAVGFFAAPFFQWWYLSITFYPAVWTFLVAAAVVWIIKSRTRRSKIVWASLVGYFTVTLCMGIYVPFILGSALVAFAFGIGYTVSPLGVDVRDRIRDRVMAVLPIVVGGLAAGAVLGVWLATRWPSIQRFIDTVYPGQRLGRTGDQWIDGKVTAVLSGPYARASSATSGAPFDANSSEASTFMLIGIFLLLPLAWSLVVRFRATRKVDWLAVSLLAVTVLLLAYMFIPGWDGLAHLLFLDRITGQRARIAVGLINMIVLVVVAARFDAEPHLVRRRSTLVVAGVTAAICAVVYLIISLQLHADHLPVLIGKVWILMIVLFVGAVFFAAAGRTLLAVLLLFVMSVASSVNVDPLYRGVYDLNSTRLVHEMKSIQADHPGQWLGAGGLLPLIALVQSGLPAFNGFQSAPTPKMWREIDPAGKWEKQWNRLAIVDWRLGTGSPNPKNPTPDQVIMTFDACASFAQKHVDYVVTTSKVDVPCLQPIESIVQGPNTFQISRVVAR